MFYQSVCHFHLIIHSMSVFSVLVSLPNDSFASLPEISSDAPQPFWWSSFHLMLLSPSDFLHFFWCSSALLIFFIGANPFLFFVSPFRVPFTGNLRSIPCHKNPIHVLKSSPLTAFFQSDKNQMIFIFLKYFHISISQSRVHFLANCSLPKVLTPECGLSVCLWRQALRPHLWPDYSRRLPTDNQT